MLKVKVLTKLCCLTVSSLMITSLFMGCGSSNSTKESSTTNGKVKISIMTRWTGGDSLAPLFQSQLKKFQEDNPDIEIQDDSISEEGAYNNKLKTAIATGTVPDIFNFAGVAGISQWAENGVIMDVSELIDDKSWSDGFIDGAFDIWDLEKYGINGKFGIPYEFSPEVIYYNPDLFEKAGIQKVPETMDELYIAIDKLKAINVIPWGVGAKDTWRTGHIHNNLIYREVGVDKVKDLGTRKAKWTDPDIIKSLEDLKVLKAKGAFEEGFEGIDYSTEQAQFYSGKAAMMCNGAWAVGDILSSNSPYKNKFKVMAFPYFKDKPQFKGDSVNFSTGLFLSGSMKGAEKDATIKLIKYLTGKECEQQRLDKLNRIGARKDVKASDSSPELFKEMVTYMSTIKVPGGDIFDYDPDPAMIDVSRNAIIDMLLKGTAEETANKIQDEIDKFDASNKK